MPKIVKENTLIPAWLVALAAMLGSFYFSEFLGYAPCILCWYQRIAMYPLVVILMVAILKKDSQVHYYALPLAIIGAAIGFYHNLLYYGIIPESLAPCTLGVSCTTKYVEYLGFISIPLMSLLSFLAIIILLLINKKHNQSS